MHAWQAIQTAVNYIEENLDKPIPLEALASTAALSPYYFQRLFARLVRKPVQEYCKLRRLSKACDALQHKGIRVLDVALAYGFSSHANFTRAFKAAYGITPEEYRRHPVILNQFIKPDLLLHYTPVTEGVPLITDGMVVEVTRRRLHEPCIISGLSGELPISKLTGGRTTGVATAGILWDTFHQKKEAIPHLLSGSAEYGVLHLNGASEGHCIYLAGAKAHAPAGGYASFTLPCGEYIVCGFEAANFKELIGSAVFLAASYMEGWLKKQGIRCGNFAAEVYYDIRPDACYMEQWIPVMQQAEGAGEIR